jgi:hypothetical protein
MFNYLFGKFVTTNNNLNETPKNIIEEQPKIISDIEIDNKSILEIEHLRNEQYEFKLTNSSLKSAFDNNDMQKMEYLTNQFGLTISENNGLFIDSALEDGNDNMAKFLVKKYKSQPSLYAKQMAHVNGHHGLAFWMDSFAEQRDRTGIDIVHKRHNTGWNECIPPEYRFEYE